MEYIKECMYPVVLVWDLILDQPLPQSSREAAHVLRRPALVRHAQGRSPGLLQVSWPRPPVLWRARTFSTLSSGLDAHVSLMNLDMKSEALWFLAQLICSFLQWWRTALFDLLNLCSREEYHRSRMNNSPLAHAVSGHTPWSAHHWLTTSKFHSL